MAHICGKCDRVCEKIEIDDGGYEEVWGAQVWTPAFSDVSDCCLDDCHTLKEWIVAGWAIPKELETQEHFRSEGLLD